MMAYGARMNYRDAEPRAGTSTTGATAIHSDSSTPRSATATCSPNDRTIDVLFHEFMADDVGMVERIYDTAGLEMTQAARGQIQAHMDAHPRGKEGQVVYDIRGDFGADPADVRAPFDFYFERFAVRAEVK